ncbi:Myosin-binding protein 1, partial [Mucuna pruriens]
MDSLQKELEEERNASAVATNEAMSMITRLQEEKATLQMEALQDLRMMEEQAEYDNEELEKVSDLLAEKEKEIQDLEAELEFYRSNVTGDVHYLRKESFDLKGKKVIAQNTGLHNIKISKFSNSKNAAASRVGDDAVILEFEEEKEYISQCLKNLEKKVHKISSHTPKARPEKLEVSKSNQRRASNGEGPRLDGHEETDLSTQKSINMLNGIHIGKDGSATTGGADCSQSAENNHSTFIGLEVSTPRGEVDLVALENEISDLNDRLEALEFDHDLLDHLTNSLQNGNDGKQFIKDIAHRLHELRKIALRR